MQLRHLVSSSIALRQSDRSLQTIFHHRNIFQNYSKETSWKNLILIQILGLSSSLRKKPLWPSSYVFIELLDEWTEHQSNTNHQNFPCVALMEQLFMALNVVMILTNHEDRLTIGLPDGFPSCLGLFQQVLLQFSVSVLWSFSIIVSSPAVTCELNSNIVLH